MTTDTIAKDQWKTYFDRVSRDHAGRPATIKVLDAATGPLNVAADLALQGFSIDTRGGTRPGSVEISVGDSPDRHVSHTVDDPRAVRQTTESNGAVDIEIEPADGGPITLVHLDGQPA